MRASSNTGGLVAVDPNAEDSRVGEKQSSALDQEHLQLRLLRRIQRTGTHAGEPPFHRLKGDERLTADSLEAGEAWTFPRRPHIRLVILRNPTRPLAPVAVSESTRPRGRHPAPCLVCGQLRGISPVTARHGRSFRVCRRSALRRPTIKTDRRFEGLISCTIATCF